MKKILFIITIFISSFVLVGCSCQQKTAADAVKDLLSQYNNLSTSVLSDLETVISKENFTDTQKESYRDILKKQYSDLKYEIVDEQYDGDTAIVSVKITVYDLYKVQSDAADHLTEHMDEFEGEDGSYDNSKFLDYKLEQMKKTTDTVEYIIDVDVVKDEDGNWTVEELSEENLEKIHGVYNYEVE